MKNLVSVIVFFVPEVFSSVLITYHSLREGWGCCRARSFNADFFFI